MSPEFTPSTALQQSVTIENNFRASQARFDTSKLAYSTNGSTPKIDIRTATEIPQVNAQTGFMKATLETLPIKLGIPLEKIKTTQAVITVELRGENNASKRQTRRVTIVDPLENPDLVKAAQQTDTYGLPPRPRDTKIAFSNGSLSSCFVQKQGKWVETQIDPLSIISSATLNGDDKLFKERQI